MRIIIILITGLFLSGCATDQCGVKTSTGHCLGTSAFKKISYEEGKIYLPEKWREKVFIHRGRSFSSHYQENIILPNAGLVLEKYYLGGFAERFNENGFKRVLTSWPAINDNINPQHLNFQSARNIYFAPYKMKDLQCFVGRTFLGQMRELTNGNGREATLRGYLCQPNTIKPEEAQSNFINFMANIKLKD
ncbi:MAG: hypothetical protein ACNI26_17005 [Terasakiella sp.]|uniref:hypothetical protein n=1 Tax=unclassified Terasakiella TaxID=2614952 RepID=UPI003AA95D1F